MPSSHVQSARSPVPDYVDWLVATFVALAGTVVAVAGGVLVSVFDRSLVADEVAAGRINVLTLERSLSRAETVTLVTEVGRWTGTGLLVTGVGLALFAVAYGVARHRANEREGASTPAHHRRRAAVCGATATVVLSMLPFSAAVGGGVAAYLDTAGPDRPVRVGSLSGLLAAVPALVVLGFTTVGLYTGLSGVGEPSLRTASVLLTVASGAFAVAFSAGLGGLGGYLADRFADGD